MAHAVIGSLDLNATRAQWVQAGGVTNNINATVIKIQHQLMHPLWKPFLHRYDTMILILETSTLPNQAVVRLNQNSSFPTTPTLLNGSGGNDDNDHQVLLTAIGYGVGSTDPFQLHNVTLGYVPNSKCALLNNGTHSITNLIYDDMMCTLAVNRSICNGDSGGPLLLTTPNGDDIQVGVSSWYASTDKETKNCLPRFCCLASGLRP